MISISFPFLNIKQYSFFPKLSEKFVFCVKLRHPFNIKRYVCYKFHAMSMAPSQDRKAAAKINRMNRWMTFHEWPNEEGKCTCAYSSLRAYRRTFMAWKTCQSPLEASAENLSSDIPIHNTAMPPSSHMIFYISHYFGKRL